MSDRFDEMARDLALPCPCLRVDEQCPTRKHVAAALRRIAHEENEACEKELETLHMSALARRDKYDTKPIRSCINAIAARRKEFGK